MRCDAASACSEASRASVSTDSLAVTSAQAACASAWACLAAAMCPPPHPVSPRRRRAPAPQHRARRVPAARLRAAVPTLLVPASPPHRPRPRRRCAVRPPPVWWPGRHAPRATHARPLRRAPVRAAAPPTSSAAGRDVPPPTARTARWPRAPRVASAVPPTVRERRAGYFADTRPGSADRPRCATGSHPARRSRGARSAWPSTAVAVR